MIQVEAIRGGYTVLLPGGAEHIVSCVEEYEDGDFVVVYFAHGEWTHESSRSGGRGARFHHRLVEKQLRPYRRGELAPAAHGSAIRAEHLRVQLAREARARFERFEERQAA